MDPTFLFPAHENKIGGFFLVKRVRWLLNGDRGAALEKKRSKKQKKEYTQGDLFIEIQFFPLRSSSTSIIFCFIFFSSGCFSERALL